jgi:putative oxidoreductase
MATGSTTVSHGTGTSGDPKGPIVLLGRLFYVLIFLMAAPNDFTKQGIAYAASQGAIGAWLIVQFLLIVTPIMHKFWGLTDPMMAQVQMINFMKNLSMLGGALLIVQFGAGPLSLDARRSS